MNALWRRIERELRQVETMFSLYADSTLVRLNETGIVRHPEQKMLALFTLAGKVNLATGGIFDPSVQSIWLALASGADPVAAAACTGWGRVRYSSEAILLPRGMKLTFNGIAQGFAADLVAAILVDEGYGNILVDMGEMRALGDAGAGEPWSVAIADASGKVQRTLDLHDRALATSSPQAQRVGKPEQSHILHPGERKPLWDTISVSAASAAVADGLSTAFCLMSRAEIDRALMHYPDARIELCI